MRWWSGLGPGIAAGTSLALWSVSSTIAYAGMVSPSAAAEVSLLFISSLLLGLVFASAVIGLGGMQGGTAVACFGATAIVHAAALGAVDATLAARGVAEGVVRGGAALIAGGAMTALAGLFLCLLARFRLGDMVRFLPYPVSTGYFCGLGAAFMAGAYGVAVGTAPGLSVVAGVWSWDDAQRLGVCVGVALLLVVLPRFRGGRGVSPVVLIAAILGYHAVRLMSGQSLAGAQAAGWLLGPFPSGPVLSLPPAAAFGALGFDVAAVLLPYAATTALLVAITTALMATGTEQLLRRELGINRELALGGAANMAAGAVGGVPAGSSVAGTTLLMRAGATGRWGVAVPAVLAVAILVAGADLLALLPRPVLAGLIMALGFEWLVLRTIRECRSLPWHEAAILLLVAAATAGIGIIEGLLFGMLLACAMFAWTYRRVPVIRIMLGGDDVQSSVARDPAEARALQAEGRRIILMRLQGYLFFLNAQPVQHALARQLDSGVDHVVLDLQHVVGLDSSAIEVFRRIEALLAGRGARWVLSAVPDGVAAQMLRHGVFADALGLPADSADRGLERMEDALLAGTAGQAAAGGLGLAACLAAIAGHEVAEARLVPFVEAMEVPEGTELIRQGDSADAMFYLAEGRAAAMLALPGEQPRHIRTLRAGTLLGELALFRGGPRTATVVTLAPSRVLRLSAAALHRMESEDPGLATIVQRAVLFHLADTITDNTRSLRLLLR